MRKTIHWSVKMHVAGRGRFRCQGPRETCPCWALDDGVFGPAGFEIDHVMPVCRGGSDDPSNLQALCPCCHALRSRIQRIERTKKELSPFLLAGFTYEVGGDRDLVAGDDVARDVQASEVELAQGTTSAVGFA